MAEKAGVPCELALLDASVAQYQREAREANNEEKHRNLRQPADSLLRILENKRAQRASGHNYITLENFPDIHPDRWEVITGDRREGTP
jgi:hypothetical protein